MSGLDGSSTKGNTPGAARAPGLSYLRLYRPEVNIRRQVHGLIFELNRPPWAVFQVIDKVTFSQILFYHGYVHRVAGN